MLGRAIRPGSTDQSVIMICWEADTGRLVANLNHDTESLAFAYARLGDEFPETGISPMALAGEDAAHVDGGFEPLGGGAYRLDLPDAAVAAGAPEVVITGADSDPDHIFEPLIIPLMGEGMYDLEEAEHCNQFEMVQRASGIVSLNPITIYQGETKKIGFDCSKLLGRGRVMASMTAPTASNASLTPTKTGIGPTWANFYLACSGALAAGTNYNVRTTITTTADSGPILLIGNVTVVED